MQGFADILAQLLLILISRFQSLIFPKGPRRLLRRKVNQPAFRSLREAKKIHGSHLRYVNVRRMRKHYQGLLCLDFLNLRFDRRNEILLDREHHQSSSNSCKETFEGWRQQVRRSSSNVLRKSGSRLRTHPCIESWNWRNNCGCFLHYMVSRRSQTRSKKGILTPLLLKFKKPCHCMKITVSYSSLSEDFL